MESSQNQENESEDHQEEDLPPLEEQSEEQHQQEEENPPEQQKEEEVAPVQEPPPKIFARTSILLSRSHDDKSPEDECAYCDGKRLVDNPETGEKGIEESKLKYNKLGFTSTKLSVQDLEHCLNCGFTRCGTYIYQRSSKNSCCEVWQYRVDTDQFQYSDSQKKVIRKFHKYLNYGDIHYQGDEKKSKDQPMQVTQSNDPNSMFKELKDKIGQLLIFYVAKAEEEMRVQNFEFDLKYLDLRDKISNQHVITYNSQKECLQSNVLMKARNSQVSIANKYDSEIKTSFVEQIKGLNAGNEELISGFEVVYKGQACFLNILLTQQGKDLFKVAKPIQKEKGKIPKVPEQPKADPKYTKFLDYLEPRIPYVPVASPKHIYEIEFHRAVYTDELFDVYVKYEKAVHKKDRDKDQLRRFVCSSPVFDPENPEDQYRINRIAPYTFETVDEDREYKQEPVYPGLGSFHFYHRIDGKLVAMGVTDITKSVLNSQYFIYDPDYSFLSLGVVGAIHEIEFMKMVQKNYNPSLKMYQLGELVLNCNKVNYKLNYKPGILICPRTKEQVKFDDVKDEILKWTKIPIAKKQEMKQCQLIPLGEEDMTENEMMAIALKDDIQQLPFLYENNRMLPIECLQQGGKDHIIPLVLQMIQHLGLLAVQNMVLELKFQKKTEPQKTEEEKKDEDEKKEEENGEEKKLEENGQNDEQEKAEEKQEEIQNQPGSPSDEAMEDLSQQKPQ